MHSGRALLRQNILQLLRGHRIQIFSNYVHSCCFLSHSMQCTAFTLALTNVLVLVLEADGRCSRSAQNGHIIVPVSIQPVLERDSASTTSCGSLFHSLTIRKLKNFGRTIVRHLGLSNFND